MEPGAGKGVVRLSPAAARLVGVEAREEEQLEFLGGSSSLSFSETCGVICVLAGSRNRRVQEAALQTLRSMTPDNLAEFLSDPQLHPRFLELIARVHAGDPVVAELVVWHPAVTDSTRKALEGAPADSPIGEAESEGDEEAQLTEFGIPESEIDPVQFRTAYQQVQQLGIGDKIKMALTGNKEWRTVLIKETIKPICCSVLKNPRITESEILTIARSSVQYDDIIRIICANREWLKKYPIRKALVENHRTPLPVALKLLATLGEKDLASLGKSKNISSVIATQARKMALTKRS